MGWKFQISFSGLTAFVLNPHDSSGAHSSARVILVNAMEEEQRHEPKLRFKNGYVVKSPWGIPTPQGLRKKRDDMLWSLTHVDLHFLPEPGVYITDPFNVVNPDKPRGHGSDKFYWVPSLKRLHPKASIINPKCLDTQPGKGLVAARVPLRHGKMWTARLARRPGGSPINCKFAALKDPGHPIRHVQYCGIEVSCEFTVPRGALTLVAVPFDGGASSGIAIKPPARGNKIKVLLDNSPIYEERPPNDDGLDEDFSLYYNLSEHCVPNGDRIVPVLPRNVKYKLANCIEIRFDDHKKA